MWLPTLVLLVLTLGAAHYAHAQDDVEPQSPCLIAWQNRAPRNRPIVNVAKNMRYRTLLSLDGGDVRATIQTAVLCELELIVKRNLINLGKVNFTDIDDFDIRLSDYFDMIAGTSAGTYLSTYIGTDGGDRTAFRNIGVDTDVPGSAYGAFQYMQAFGPMVTDAFGTVPGGSTDYDVVGPWVYNYFDGWFGALYNNISTAFQHDPNKASLMWTWSRASNGGGVTSMAMYKDNQQATGGVMHMNLDGTISEVDDVDYYVWQGIRGSTSWPPRVPTYMATTTPQSASNHTFAVIDGAITSMDPTASAFPFMQKRMNVKARRTAILSIGTGAVLDTTVEDVDWVSHNEDYVRAWVSTLATRGKSAVTFKTLYDALYSPYQYVRIDQDFSTGPDGDDCGGLFTEEECPMVRMAVQFTQSRFLPTYTLIGARWAEAYYRDMNQFVRKFLLDGIDHD